MQVQPTVHLFGTETRIAASDPLAALVAAGAVLALLGGRVIGPIWRSRWIWFWLAAMTLVLVMALGIGFVELGTVSGWALQNRLLGWGVILAYFFAGAALRRQFGSPAAGRFLDSFVVAGGAIAALASVWLLATNAGLLPWWNFRDQVSGFIGNANAFGVFVVLALAIIWVSDGGEIGRRAGGLSVIWAATGYLTLSRATWLGMAVAAFLAMLAGRLGLRRTVLWFALPVAGAVAAAAAGSAGSVAWTKFEAVAPGNAAATVVEPSMNERARLAEIAIRLWASAPLFGVGLGVHWQREREAFPARPQLIHGTPLWLLAETGLVGLGAFGGFFLHAVILLYRARGARSGEAGRLDAAVLLFLPAVAAMSLFHDLLYQRVLWIVLGFALAAPHAPSPPETSAETRGS
ncbi:MAG: O-antigen ligase family protein [Rhodospirillaceae bacterium]|nr:O-antigen ligase family protein [Rhodospirillaceae bacterium]